MKTRVLYLFAALGALCSCTDEKVTTVTTASDEFYCSIENDESTRTSLDQNNNVTWSAKDQLVIFKKSSIPSKYQISENHVGKTSGSFYKINSDEFNAGSELDHNIALYPYQENIEITKLDSDSPTSSYKISGYNFPAEQTYAEKSFANGAFPMAAVSDNNDLTFRNICGGIKLQLKGTQMVTSITIEGKNSEKLAGDADIIVYSDENLKPAITMASNALTSVTLNCGAGVQLSESSATGFIIALFPVAFDNGFTVTVTDDADKTYSVETDKANIVLRSSLLSMPIVVLKEDVVEEEETPDSDETFVEVISLNKKTLTLAPGMLYTLTAKVVPTDATDKTLVWSSDAAAIANVNQNGVVTAVSDGSAVITVVASGGVSESCTVTVISPPTSQATADYVDEYGVNHGKGIAIGATVWAPVNCGYKVASGTDNGYPYGKLYQWGRKYGQGYSTSYDSSEPSIEDGPVSLKYGQSEANANVFFISYEDYRFDWLTTQNNALWNSGTESTPVKTDYDPCPDGWRVPAFKELNILCNS